jgi:hypothetical protein
MTCLLILVGAELMSDKPVNDPELKPEDDFVSQLGGHISGFGRAETFNWDEYINSLNQKKINTRLLLIGAASAISLTAVSLVVYYSIWGGMPERNHALEAPGDIDDVVSAARNPHYISGNSTEGSEREILCTVHYVTPTEQNELGLAFKCDQPKVQLNVHTSKVVPRSPASFLHGEDQKEQGQTQTQTPVETELAPLSVVEPTSVQIDVPNRNHWLKEAGAKPIGTGTGSNGEAPKVVEKPVTSKYCSRFLERKGVCIIPRGIQ